MSIGRRDFLKTASMAAGAAALTGARAGADASQRTAAPHLGDVHYTPVRDYPIRPMRGADVTLTDPFWKPKVARNAAVTIPFEVKKLVEGEREFAGNILEAAIISLQTYPDPTLQAQVDKQIEALTARTPARDNNGFEVAAAYFQATGRRDLVDRASKTADAIYEDFKARNPPFSGGERDAINCIQLYRVTGEKKHLDLAKHYLDIRGLDNSVNRSRHNQSYKPVLEQREAVGHAVNCVTLMVSLADVGVLTGLKPYFTSAERMWTDAVEKKMYVTGGVGTTGNEGFGEPYVLPNISAYSETCAVLMFITLNHRLFLATGDSKYIDVMERGMYNNALSGVSTSGDLFFYVNRLASAGDGRDLRWSRASLECCPPNLVRFLASMPGFIYAQAPTGAIFVNLYVSSETPFTVNGQKLTLAIDSEMPWGGKSKVTIRTERAAKAAIKLRIPGWARYQPVPGGLYDYTVGSVGITSVMVNSARVATAPDRLGYVSIDRVWVDGDVIELKLPVEPRQVVADARVKANRGKIAIERGPIVYCAESQDLNGQQALELAIDPERGVTTAPRGGLEDGATALLASAWNVTKPETRSTARPSTLIPYHLWGNRGAAEMSVWLPTREYAPGDVGPAGGVIFYINPNSAADGWRYLEAAPYDQSAGATWGCFRTLIPGARATAVGTGRQNTRDMLAACSDAHAAAALCANLKVNGIGGWFLPSRDELALLYKNVKATAAADFGDRGASDNFSYWASSQLTADMASHIDFADLGRQHFDDKDFPRRVRAIRAW